MLVGGLGQCIESCKKLEKIGIDEVILKINGYGHRTNFQSIAILGEYALPKFDHLQAIPENGWEAVEIGVERYQI